MTAKLVILSAFLICSNGLSIGTVSDKHVVKRESIGDLFPDWVPFKNKHGDELGEFVPVVPSSTKNKVKKRLAPPMNFILRAVADAESEDYYDKGQGGGDNEDNYESKDWSDLNRPAETPDTLNHTDLSEIDGVVDILTKPPANSIVDAINNGYKTNAELATGESDEDDERREVTTEIPSTDDGQNIQQPTNRTNDENDYDEGSSEKQKSNAVENTNENKAKLAKEKSRKESEDDMDYDEGSSEKKINPVEDVSERKAKILDAVDELKERHAQESRAISNKATEEEMYREEFERNRLHPVEARDKYGNRNKYKKIAPDYDEYDDRNGSVEDKYKVQPIAKVTPEPKRTTPFVKKSKHIETGKLSVFKNPQLYMIYDDIDETTVTPKREKQKFSARYNSTPISKNNDERISLVPEDAKEGEPTLFIVKKRKNKKRINRTTTQATDSTGAESVTENTKLITPKDTTAADTRTDTKIETAPSSTGSDELTTSVVVTAAGSDISGTGSDISSPGSDISATGSDISTTGSGETEPPAASTVTRRTIAPTHTPRVADTLPASSEHKKEKTEDYRTEKGGGREHDSEHTEEHEEHGKKAYEGQHKDTKTSKGHHDKENHLGKYDDHGGVDKHHSEESGHYGDHHHEEHGKKHAKYEESGKHSKGHNTKGSHDVHKKEEYEKKVEFFEEEGDSAEESKHGGYNHEREHSEGGHFKKDKLKAGHEQHSKGETGHYGKGGHAHFHKGHKQSGGQDSHGKKGQLFFQKGGRDSGQKWVYHHGIPARTASLVVIDRRGDQMFHGPHYYG